MHFLHLIVYTSLEELHFFYKHKWISLKYCNQSQHKSRNPKSSEFLRLFKLVFSLLFQSSFFFSFIHYTKKSTGKLRKCIIKG